MPRNLALSLAAVAVLVLGVAGFFWSRADGTRGQSTAQGGDAESAIAGSVEVAPTPGIESPEIESTGLVSTDVEPDTTRLTPSEAALAAGELVMVQLQAADGLPEDEPAKVYVVSGAPARLDWAKRSRPQQRVRARRGDEFTADSNGQVVIPRHSHTVKLAAETSRHWGWIDLDPDVERVELDIERTPALYARVVDADGNPEVGVPVEARGNRTLEMTATTDALGVARFHDADRLSQWELSDALADRVTKVTVTMQEKFLRVEPVTLAGDLLPREPIAFTLPPHGGMELHFQFANGKPWSFEEGSVRLISEDHLGVLGFEGDRVVLPRVALGQEFDVDLSGDALTLGSSFEVTGPTEPEQRIVYRHAPAGDLYLLIARLVDAEGQPMGNRTFEAFAVGGTRPSSGPQPPGPPSASAPKDTWSRTLGRHESDSRGIVRLQLNRTRATGERWSLELLRPSKGLGARFDVPGGLSLGATDLGTATLVEPPLAIAGRVTDMAGESMSGVEIKLSSVRRSSSENPSVRSTGLPEARSDRAGRFEFRTWLPLEGKVHLEASKSRYVQTRERLFDVGTPDATITMSRKGTLVGRILSDPGFDPRFLEIHAHPSPPASRVKARIFDRERVTDGQWSAGFELKGLEPVHYDIVFRLEKNDEVVHTTPAVSIHGGDENYDARLDPVDLRGRVRTITLMTHDADGHQARPAWVHWRPAGAADDAWHGANEVDRGGSRIFTRAEAIDVRVHRRNHRTAKLYGITEDHLVKLERGVPVRFSVPAAAKLDPDKPCLLRIRRVGADYDISVSRKCDERGEMTWRCEPGTYEASAWIEEHEDWRRSPTEDWFPLVVHDTEEEQWIVLAELSAAIDRDLAAQGAAEDE